MSRCCSNVPYRPDRNHAAPPFAQLPAPSPRLRGEGRGRVSCRGAQSCFTPRPPTRRGYRFATPVVRVVAGAVTPGTAGVSPALFQRAGETPALPGGVAAPPASPDSSPLSDRPSVAVLPFANLSGDPQQDYFSEACLRAPCPRPGKNRSLEDEPADRHVCRPITPHRISAHPVPWTASSRDTSETPPRQCEGTPLWSPLS
jgi:hypothetical protein